MESDAVSFAADADLMTLRYEAKSVMSFADPTQALPVIITWLPTEADTDWIDECGAIEFDKDEAWRLVPAAIGFHIVRNIDGRALKSRLLGDETEPGPALGKQDNPDLTADLLEATTFDFFESIVGSGFSISDTKNPAHMLHVRDGEVRIGPVSYTHLTLPTILLV